MGTVELICEGACNPGRLEVDGRVATFRRLDLCRHHRGLDILPDRLLRDLKRLRHTPHSPRGADLATCLTCHHTRRWGNQ